MVTSKGQNGLLFPMATDCAFFNNNQNTDMVNLKTLFSLNLLRETQSLKVSYIHA